VLLLMVLGFGCTPAEIATWSSWHDRDPDAAMAFAKALPAEPVQARSPRWDRIAWCESGGQWAHRPVTNRTGTYSGGLMIWQRAWVVYGGQQFAGWAYQASKADQIVVAERILADQGWGAWDCA
jgi:resuscitation-promoting factor RpfA